ncbi:DUF2946 domain-containing protein [Pseudomonas sp. ZM23]|uniref:DUF2946 domain-containing protein n=1 Tax=Pseudomonas triclosanedens TaxID=2961893 RepID=A0ABY6ZTY4_9PSED|nr:DUF2946 domain-containing protein [Pseudomonas triclosanedens]MCP8463402.1 DUF2946 domain-containing protein [Pseudomonas triclosanedens]MCP8469539.1 DUF2946 domain-containing protein [Pseudomonas triclosanedens]MCP8474203.1 DUF2946 domain-containing protein [Pseudomonas triclosanedens]WAI48407.1 DUF2946 domain-containing protein [Pseudomonas triclosanedens]
MTRRTRQGVGTWLALFAMLMIYVGPLVSQSLPMDHPMPMDHAMPMQHGKTMQHGDVLASLAELACSDAQREHHAVMMSHGEQPLTADSFMEKCGYCSLLIHSPPLTTPPVLLDHGLSGARAPVSSFATSAIPASPVFPGARSRAPPLLIG